MSEATTPRNVRGAGRDPFAALRQRNYRLYFIGQFISMCGSWLQTVAQGWLVWQITHNAMDVGVVTAAGSLPTFFLSLPGGVVADRVDRQKLVMVTQTLAGLLAGLLGFLAGLKGVQVWHVAAVAAVSGVVNAFDMPSRQAFVVQAVDRRTLMNAIALNSVMFNGARVVGPAIAGMMIHWVGVAGCFYLNAVSYVAAIIAIGRMRVEAAPRAEEVEPPLRSMLAGLRYVWDTPVVRRLILLLGITGIFGWSLSVVLPAMADHVLRGGSAAYGWLMTAQGIGAVIGALILANLGDTPHKRALVYAGLALFALGLLVFSLAGWLPLACVAMAVSGVGMIIFSATGNTVVQSLVPEALRGRIMGVWALVFAGSAPLGSLQIGTVARIWGAPVSIQVGVAAMTVAGVVIYWTGLRARQSDAARARPAAG